MLDGPRIAPRSGGPARQLIVFVHGYGANGDDLIGIGEEWAELLPDAAFVAPHAPDPCGQSPMGLEWFPLTTRSPEERWAGVTHAAPALDQFLDAELVRHNVPPSALAIIGFSQGTMMALHVGLRRAAAPGAIVGYSGILVLGGNPNLEQLGAAIRAKPPVLLVHGDEDELIPPQATFQAAQVLATWGVPTEWHLSLGIGHGIDREGLRHGGEFLTRRLGVGA